MPPPIRSDRDPVPTSTSARAEIGLAIVASSVLTLAMVGALLSLGVSALSLNASSSAPLPHGPTTVLRVTIAMALGYAGVFAPVGLIVGVVVALVRGHAIARRPGPRTLARAALAFVGLEALVVLSAPWLADLLDGERRVVAAVAAGTALAVLLAVIVVRLPREGRHPAWDRIRMAVLFAVAVPVGVAVVVRSTSEPRPAAATEPFPPLTRASSSGIALLGVDGADWITLDRLIAAGVMPNLARAREDGAAGDLYVRFPFTPPSWTTILSGVDDHTHGIVAFAGQVDAWGDLVRRPRIHDITARVLSERRQLPPPPAIIGWLSAPADLAAVAYARAIHPFDRPLVLLDATHVAFKRLWQIAEDAGLATGTFGVDLSWPAEQVRGFLVSDRFVRGERADAVYPDRLVMPLDALAIGSPDAMADPGDTPSIDPGGRDADVSGSREAETAFFVRTARRQHREWLEELRMARRLFETECDGLDLVTLKFRQPDTMKHYLLPFLRPDAFPWLDVSPDASAAVLEVLHDAYYELDLLIGEIRDAGWTLCIVSDHGFYPNRAESPRQDSVSLDADTLLDRLGWLVRGEDGDIDWTRTRAYDPGTPTPAETSGLRLNLRGREPNGVVPVAERASALEALVRDLGSVRYADSGEPVFTTIETDAAGFDVVVRHPLRRPLRDVLEPLTRRVVVAGRSAPMRSVFALHPTYGGHRGGTDVAGYGPAVLLLCGPDVRRGVTLESAEDLDVTPTILRLLGVPLSAELQGRVLDEALAPAFLEAHPITTVPGYGPHRFDPELLARARAGGGSEATRKEMVDRIRALGYLN